jgi:transcriptional regulator with XRE-family HTH domain
MLFQRKITYFLYMGLRETFRQNLFYYRKKAGLTQEQLSEKADLNLNYIASIECSASKFPKPETIDAIAKALGIRPSQLFEEEGCPVNTICFDKEEFSNKIIDELSIRLSKEMKDYLDKKI